MNSKSYRKSLVCFVLCVVFAGTAYSQDARSLFARGSDFQRRGNYYSAIETYRECLEINPRYGDAWYALSQCTYNLGEYDLAVEYADQAAKYARNFSEIQNLKGMALISLGRFDEGKDVFLRILDSYPNDVDARFGLAQLDLFNGSLSAAEARYLDALKRDGTNRKALLSLALVSAAQDRNDLAEHYVNQALKYHSGEAEVHYLAAYLSSLRGDFTEAEQHARGAVQIRGDWDKAYELLSHILYAQGRYSEVVDLCEFRIGRDRSLSSAWYMKGLAQTRLSQIPMAIDTYTMGLTIAPQDEIMRLALENLVRENVSIEDPRRANWARYHMDKAAEYRRVFDGPSERYEYQKALSVDPLSREARQAFANLLEREGLYELYLEQLKFIKENFYSGVDKGARTEQQIKNDDAMEALESLMHSNLARRWGVSPFYLDKTRWNIGIYYVRSPVQLVHADSEEISAVAAGNIFSGTASTVVDVQTRAVSGYGEAYRLAREAGRDYFAILSVDETERSYSLDAQIYSARTGTRTGELHVYRTGNDRVSRALRRFRQAMLDMLPIRGTVLQNAQGVLLVDLGKSDGIVPGAVFDVVRKGAVVTNDTGPGVFYSRKDTLGTVTLSAVNEEISEGAFKKKGFYDILNVGDEVILISLPKDAGEQSRDGNSETDVRPAADAGGEPATKSAELAERESLRESLSSPQRESTLTSLVKSIMKD